MANITELPNPFTPLAFLPPALASQFEVWRYVLAATLGAYVWDVGLNLGNDYALLFKYRIRFPTIVYFLSRAFTLAYILAFFIFAGEPNSSFFDFTGELSISITAVAPVENCNAFAIAITICAALSDSITAMLFLLRVTAVWGPNKIVYAVFSILWIAVLGACITSPLGVRGAHIGSTMQCIITDVMPGYVEVATIMPLVNDTAIFFAINYRILAHILVADSFMARIRVFFGGKGLSALSQALLQGGQHFYLIAIATNITLLVLLKLSQLPPVYHAMMSIPGLALVNAMACLVFRRIKFGLISSDGTSNISTTTFSSDFHATANPKSLPLHFHRTDATTLNLERTTNFPLEVRSGQKEICEVEDVAGASPEISV
ncbi:hypothetical protein MSAN_02314900 [Mycena sanguinolenta]|uniref:Uncharacterized protein n=1 Tax=Mycena sanguinolenta TaxID=230812 RepID=A0A8H7CHC7_9AGAR|nr:hypothetical protein MSAN_02314900 [Mycena sanguinolenta]